MLFSLQLTACSRLGRKRSCLVASLPPSLPALMVCYVRSDASRYTTPSPSTTLLPANKYKHHLGFPSRVIMEVGAWGNKKSNKVLTLICCLSEQSTAIERSSIISSKVQLNLELKYKGQDDVVSPDST